MFIDNAASAAWRLATSILDAMPQPIFVIDQHRHLYFHNKSAGGLIRKDRMFQVSLGKLDCSNRKQAKQLQAFVRQLAGMVPSDEAIGTLELPAPHCFTPYAATLSAVDFSGALPGRHELGLLMLDGCLGEPVIDGKAMQVRFGLSDAETRVATLIAEGGSVLSASRSLGITVATVRSHLKAIFRKAGIGRQQDLIRLANNGK